MSLLKVVEKEEATGKAAEIYESMLNGMGFIPNGFKAFSISAHVLDQQYSNMLYYMRHKTLGGRLLALIRLLVSEKEQCRYCITMNSGMLLQYGILPDALAEIKADPAKAPLDEKELPLLLFVLKVTGDSSSVTEADVAHLRSLGWTDSDILDASFHGAGQVSFDKLLNSFGIEPD